MKIALKIQLTDTLSWTEHIVYILRSLQLEQCFEKEARSWCSVPRDRNRPVVWQLLNVVS